MKIGRKTESIRFDTGISVAEYAEGVVGHSPSTGNTSGILPGSTTVSEALADIFPGNQSITAELMDALVAGNPASLRTQSGFSQTARETIELLRSRGTPAAERAVRELEELLEDTELFEQYRASLLET